MSRVDWRRCPVFFVTAYDSFAIARSTYRGDYVEAVAATSGEALWRARVRRVARASPVRELLSAARSERNAARRSDPRPRRLPVIPIRRRYIESQRRYVAVKGAAEPSEGNNARRSRTLLDHGRFVRIHRRYS